MDTLEKAVVKQLIQYINSASDFGYDDQEVELRQLLAKEGKRWRWTQPDIYGNQRVEIYKPV